MTVHEARAEAVGKARAEARGQVIRGAESWQFFAFVFAASVAFLVAVIEELPQLGRSFLGLDLVRLGLKVLAFAVIGYATLFSARGRNWLIGLLTKVKEAG